MASSTKTLGKFAVFFCAVMLVALFIYRMGGQRVKIMGRYYIEKFEEGEPVYYIVNRGVDDLGGVLDGVVLQIGWRGDELLAEVQRLSSNDVSGWYKLNMRHGTVIGPIMDQQEINSFRTVKSAEFYQDPAIHKNL